MRLDKAIQAWAHMLDESFREDARSARDEAALPRDENEKFKFSDVIVDGMDADGIEKVLNEIWPEWYEHFTEVVEKEPLLSLEGQRRDVDDYDVWEISVEDTYGGMDAMADMMIDDIQERWHGKDVTLREVVDTELKRLIDTAGEDIDLSTLEANGKCVYRGRMRWGGSYPG